MKFLTRQEQMFLAIVLGLLLAGWLVKYYRTAHPSESGGHGNAPAETTAIQ